MESIKVFNLEFNQRGLTFYASIFKRLLNGKLTLYCWNLSTMERLKPLILKVRRPKVTLNYEKLWNRVYLGLEDQRLYSKDFWMTPKDPDYYPDEYEIQKATLFMHNFT